MADPTTTYINLVDVVPDWEQRLDENLESDWDNILGLLSLNQVGDAPEKTLQWALAQQWKKKREQFGKEIADLQKNVEGQTDMEVDGVVNLSDEVDGLSLSDKDAEKVADAEVDKVMTALDGSKELKKKDEKQVRKELKKKAVDALRKGDISWSASRGSGRCVEVEQEEEACGERRSGQGGHVDDDILEGFHVPLIWLGMTSLTLVGGWTACPRRHMNSTKCLSLILTGLEVSCLNCSSFLLATHHTFLRSRT